jgi:tetratricopeptide (TPR) repeat protein
MISNYAQTLVKNKLNLIITFVFFCFLFTIQCQNISKREKEYLDIRKEIERNPANALKFVQKFHNKVQLKKDNRNIGLAVMLYGQYYFYTSEIQKADSCFARAYIFFEKIVDQKQMAKAKVASANVLYVNGKYKESIDVFLNSIELFRKAHDTLNMANLYNNVGSVFLQLKHYEKAKIYYEKAAFMYKHTTDLNGQSLVLRKLAKIYFEDDQFEKAIKFNLEAKAICVKDNDSLGIGNCYVNLGTIDFEWKKDYGSALQKFILAEQIFKNIGAECEAPFATHYIGLIYFNTKKYTLAKEFLLKSLHQLKKCEYYYKLPDTYKTLAYTEKELGNYEKAFDYMT